MKTFFYLLLFLSPVWSLGQQGEASQPRFQSGLHQLSISATNLQYGLPFIRLAPIHPGLEVGATLLKRTGQRSEQGATLRLGYFHHLLAAAPYLNANYYYQYQPGEHLGIKANAGMGYAHVFYPGDGYRFDESSGSFQNINVNAPYFMATLGTGITYRKPKKIQPFIDYELWLLGSTNIITSSFKIGVNLPL